MCNCKANVCSVGMTMEDHFHRMLHELLDQQALMAHSITYHLEKIMGQNEDLAAGIAAIQGDVASLKGGVAAAQVSLAAEQTQINAIVLQLAQGGNTANPVVAQAISDLQSIHADLGTIGTGLGALNTGIQSEIAPATPPKSSTGPAVSAFVQPSAISGNIGDTVSLVVVGQDANGVTVGQISDNFVSGDTSVATVDASGNVVLVAAGSTSITVSVTGCPNVFVNVSVATPTI